MSPPPKKKTKHEQSYYQQQTLYYIECQELIRRKFHMLPQDSKASGKKFLICAKSAAPCRIDCVCHPDLTRHNEGKSSELSCLTLSSPGCVLRQAGGMGIILPPNQDTRTTVANVPAAINRLAKGSVQIRSRRQETRLRRLVHSPRTCHLIA